MRNRAARVQGSPVPAGSDTLAQQRSQEAGLPATEGARTWIVPDGYLPTPPADGRPYQSHEALCILNTGSRDARVLIDVFFEGRAPVKDIAVTVAGERTFHIRRDKPEHLGGAALPTWP